MSQTQNRTARDSESREVDAREQTWVNPDLLPVPNPIDGYVFRWVRVSTLNNADAMNISAKLREGWVPCKKSDHKEIEMAVVENARFKDNIVIGGLMLCKAPVEMARSRKAHFKTLTQNQMKSVDQNLMREQDPRMPIHNDRKTRVTFGPDS